MRAGVDRCAQGTPGFGCIAVAYYPFQLKGVVMSLTVSIIKNGQVLASKPLSNPQLGDVEAAISELLAGLRNAGHIPLWPFQVDVR